MDEEVKVRPHVLIPLDVFIEKQSEFIDSLIPELKKNDGSEINLNNVKQFDELLTHLELTFRTNYEASYSTSSDYSNIRIPSLDILRVLLTLASRCRSSNWSDTTTSIDGLQTTNEQVRVLNEDYYNSIHKPPLQSRSLLLLQNYFSYLSEYRKLDDPTLLLLYDQFRKVFDDFIVRNRTVTKSTLSSSNSNTIRPVIKQSSSPKRKGDITSYFQSPPRSSPPRIPLTDINQNETGKHADDMIISDSEGTVSDIGSGAVDMEREVNKFQSYNITPTKKLSRNILRLDDEQMTSGLNSSEALFNSSSMDRDKNNRSRQRMMSPSKFPNWHSLKIFDDSILSKKLNPRLNRNFNLWQLVNWTFYCADKSSEIQRQSPNSNYSAFHLIYSAHRDTIDFIFDFISYNFQYELKNDPLIKKSVSDGNALASSRLKTAKFIEDSDSILLSKLVTQLGASQRDWYDRAVEYIFNGLGNKSKEAPKSCYDREKGLINHDHSVKEQFYNFSSSDFVHFNDNMDSMKIRYKICMLLYQWSKYFHNIKGGSTNFDILGKREFLTQLAFKFNDIDFSYIIKFYCAFDPPYESIKERQAFLEELSNILILEITKTVEANIFSIDTYETIIVDDEDANIHEYKETIAFEADPALPQLYLEHPIQLRNIYKMLDTIGDQYIYSAIIEDETYNNFDEFTQQWMKINFLFEWSINLAFERYDDFIKSRTGDKVKIRSSFETIRSKCKTVDQLRSKLFQEFVIDHYEKDSYNFKLTEEQVQKIQRKNPIINCTEDIFDQRFYKYLEPHNSGYYC
ncbi:hypothetical protein DFJ63DRAFT_333204 [Scheffersomyces coipomensis]|uniref:uncharacterized protein n=1 Tax=Scheffersomyces coipomensis TaxID=1788519 RepID=UPI00315C6A29